MHILTENSFFQLQPVPESANLRRDIKITLLPVSIPSLSRNLSISIHDLIFQHMCPGDSHLLTHLTEALETF